MPNASWWKEFYRAERESLGTKVLERMIADAPKFSLPASGALIFPHTRLMYSGHLIAAASRAVVDSGRDTVLAIGVLHGGTRGDPSLRGIHGPGAPEDKDIWRDEFSLDNFSALLATAAEVLDKPVPKLIVRYPFLTGDNPESLAGFDELQMLVKEGAALVATADLVHHGAGYGTPKGEQLSSVNAATLAIARRWIEEQFSLLSHRDYEGFLAKAESVRSDFRDAGPVIAALAPNGKYFIHDLMLVNYADVLHAEEPTWVAASLVELE
ncbi:MAG TPA: hypothetical protein VG537_05575 [Candidatus Kapabacteria bacterium]|jgi:predicted class III extradiol MEMO1 family dioxygenase|nr:hypothetical protein [Candidatus Kapabacteria bacterium]